MQGQVIAMGMGMGMGIGGVSRCSSPRRITTQRLLLALRVATEGRPLHPRPRPRRFRPMATALSSTGQAQWPPHRHWQAAASSTVPLPTRPSTSPHRASLTSQTQPWPIERLRRIDGPVQSCSSIERPRRIVRPIQSCSSYQCGACNALGGPSCSTTMLRTTMKHQGCDPAWPLPAPLRTAATVCPCTDPAFRGVFVAAARRVPLRLQPILSLRVACPRCSALSLSLGFPPHSFPPSMPPLPLTAKTRLLCLNAQTNVQSTEDTTPLLCGVHRCTCV